MTISVIPGTELTERDIHRWYEIQDSNPLLSSPYFCPEFTQAVASVRNDVYISIIKVKDVIVGFFPFQKRRFGFGIPVGGMLSDIHGLIMENNIEIDVKQLLKLSGLVSYEFYHLPQWQNSFNNYIKATEVSHFIDLTSGYENYKTILAERKSKTPKDAAYKLRKLKRDFNNVEFHHLVTDKSILDLLLNWKSSQYRKSKIVDVFSFTWTKKLLHIIHELQSERFSGILSTLSVEGNPIAIHMGMRSSNSWNWWFPRHDTAYNKYSPGILLRLDAIEYAEKIGIKYVDLGCGDETTYKPHLSTNTIVLGSGSVVLSSFYTSIRNLFYHLEQWIRSSVFYSIVKIPGRIIFKFIRHGKYN